MEHVVFHPGPDGSPAFRRFASLDDAVRFVEHLRNVEGVSEVSVHALSPVPLAFRAYYKVEVPGDAAVAEVPAQPMPADAVVEPSPEPVPSLAGVPSLEVVPPLEPVAAVEAEMPDAQTGDEAAEPQLGEVPMVAAVAAAEQPSNGKRSLGFFAH